jgi:anti-sigma factor RsiW
MQALKLQVIESESTIAVQDRRIAELEALINELRCGDLHRFYDRELPDDRRDAYRLHLATCERCQRQLNGLMQETVATAGASATKNATATRRTRKR